MAHHWLLMEEAATEAASGEGEAEFYESKIKCSGITSKTSSLIETHKILMHAPTDSVMGMKSEFGFDHALA